MKCRLQVRCAAIDVALAVGVAALAPLALAAPPAPASSGGPPQVVTRLPEGYEVVDRIVALVDDALVTLYEVQRAHELNRAQAAATAAPGAEGSAETLDAALDALIDEALILSEAEELELKVTEGDVDANLRRIKSASGWNDDQLEEAVREMGFPTLRAYRDHTSKELLKARTFMYKVGSRVNVGAVDVQRVLDEEYEGGRSAPEVRVRSLLRRVSPSATEDEIAEASRMCTWVHQQAVAAPELFVDLVRRFSEDDATRFDDGDLGFIRAGQLEDSNLEKALFSTPVGQVTPIVRSRDGFRFFAIVEQRRAPVRDIEGLKNEIYDRLVQREQEQIYTAWLRELRETHFVERRL